MTHIERKQREKEEIRKSIIDAAIKIAAKEGWYNVTIRKIADSIEYTPPIVYEYFENKEDLMKEIIYIGFDKLHLGLEELQKSKIPAKEAIRFLSVQQWEFAENYKELFQVMFSLERPVPNEKMLEQIRAIEGYFEDIAGNDKKLVLEYMTNWICLTHGIISFLLIKELPDQFKTVDKKSLFLSMIDRFLNSLK